MVPTFSAFSSFILCSLPLGIRIKIGPDLSSSSLLAALTGAFLPNTPWRTQWANITLLQSDKQEKMRESTRKMTMKDTPQLFTECTPKCDEQRWGTPVCEPCGSLMIHLYLWDARFVPWESVRFRDTFFIYLQFQLPLINAKKEQLLLFRPSEQDFE